jgi:iron(III) transport system substrate-binding protein
MNMKKIIASVLVLSLGLVSLAGCSVGTAATKPSSKELTIYTAIEEPQINKYLEPFKRKYPDIKLEIVRASTGDMTARLMAEKSNPKADVIWGLAATSLIMADKQGMLEPYKPKGGENIPKEFKGEGENPAWYGIDAFITAITVNKEELSKKKLPIPTSYEELIKSEYKGMIVMPNPQSSGTGFIAVSAWMQLMGKDKAFEYMDKLHNNIGVYTHSGSLPAKMAASGEYPIGISYDWKGLQLKKEGYPVEVIFPKEGSGWDLEANGLVKKANIKEEAKIFLDYVLSKEAMLMYGENYAVTTLDVGSAIPEGFPKKPLEQMIKNNLSWAGDNRDSILKQWIGKYDSKSEPKK